MLLWLDQLSTPRTAAALESILSRGFNVTDPAFGATGDGVTNDAAAIQAALDAINTAGGGSLYFPLGTYMVRTQLTVGSNTRLYGAGRGQTIIKAATGLAANVMLTNKNQSSGGVQNVAIDGIEFDGNTAGGRTDAAALIVFTLSDAAFLSNGSTWRNGPVIFRDNYVHACPNVGVALQYTEGSLVTGNEVAHCERDGIMHSGPGSDIRVTGNWVHHCGDDGLPFNAGEPSAVTAVGQKTGIVVTGNVIGPGMFGGSGVGGGGGVALRGCGHASVTGNTIIEPWAEGVLVENYDVVPSSDIVVEANLVKSPGLVTSGAGGTTTGGHGVFLWAGSSAYTGKSGLSRIRVTGNIVTDPRGQGVRLLGGNASGPMADIDIDGNTINCASSPSGGGLVGVHADGVAISDLAIRRNRVRGSQGTGVNVGDDTNLVTRVTVDGNEVIDSVGVALQLRKVADPTVVSNRATDTRAGGSKTQTYGLYLNVTSGRVVVGQNDFSGNLTGEYVYNGAQGTTVFNGRLRGSATWSPGPIGDYSSVSTTVSVPGAAVGDVATAGFTSFVAGNCFLDAFVTSADTVTVRYHNMTGGSITPTASGTLIVHVNSAT